MWVGQTKFKATMKECRQFFTAKYPMLVDCYHALEMERRLLWLSEGILKANLNLKEFSYEDISQEEIKLFHEFVSWLIEKRN